MDTNVLRQHDMALKQPRPEWEKTQKTKKAASLLQLTACVFCGAPEEIRTPGLQVRSLLLYPAELRARCEKLCIAIALSCQILSRKKSFFVRKPLPAFRLPVWQKAQGSPFPRTRCHRAGNSTAGQDSEYARQKTERRSMEVTSPQRRRGDRPGSQSHRLRRQDDRNVDAARQNSPGECVITSGTSDCMRCKKIAKAGQVPAFFVSPVVVWGMAGLACAGA